MWKRIGGRWSGTWVYEKPTILDSQGRIYTETQEKKPRPRETFCQRLLTALVGSEESFQFDPLLGAIIFPEPDESHREKRDVRPTQSAIRQRLILPDMSMKEPATRRSEDSLEQSSFALKRATSVNPSRASAFAESTCGMLSVPYSCASRNCSTLYGTSFSSF